VRIYGLDYKNRLENAGFSVQVINYIDQFSDDEIFRNGFMKGEEIFLCTKF